MSAARAGGYLQSASWSAPISDLEVARRIAFLLELGRRTPTPERTRVVEVVRAELIDYCYGRRELGPARLEEDARYLGFAICDRALLIQGESDALL